MTTLTWLGHAAFRIDSDRGKRIYIDPFLTGNPTMSYSAGVPIITLGSVTQPALAVNNQLFDLLGASFAHEGRMPPLVADNRLEDYRVKDEWEGRKKVAKAMGFLFFGTGLVLLVLIIYAMTSRLGH